MVLESANTNTLQTAPPFNWRTWIVLGFLSMGLSIVGPLCLFGAIPLIFCFLFYGRSKGLVLGASCLVFLLFVNIVSEITPIMILMFGISFLNAAMLSEVVLRNISPDKGLVMIGGVIAIITVVFTCFYLLFGEKIIDPKLEIFFKHMASDFNKQNADIIAKGGDDVRILKDMLSDPKKILSQIKMWAPTAFFTSVVLGAWISLFIVLRTSSMWNRFRNYSYTVQNFINFKTPDYLIWVVVLALVLTLGGEYILGEIGSIIGMNVLYCLGIFYFIQGFGVYYAFLTSFKIVGMLRSLFIFLAMIFAFRLLALIGFFDLWINFRKQLKKIKDKDKGENI